MDKPDRAIESNRRGPQEPLTRNFYDWENPGGLERDTDYNDFILNAVSTVFAWKKGGRDGFTVNLTPDEIITALKSGEEPVIMGYFDNYAEHNDYFPAIVKDCYFVPRETEHVLERGRRVQKKTLIAEFILEDPVTGRLGIYGGSQYKIAPLFTAPDREVFEQLVTEHMKNRHPKAVPIGDNQIKDWLDKFWSGYDATSFSTRLSQMHNNLDTNTSVMQDAFAIVKKVERTTGRLNHKIREAVENLRARVDEVNHGGIQGVFNEMQHSYFLRERYLLDSRLIEEAEPGRIIKASQRPYQQKNGN